MNLKREDFKGDLVEIESCYYLGRLVFFDKKTGRLITTIDPQNVDELYPDTQIAQDIKNLYNSISDEKMII